MKGAEWLVTIYPDGHLRWGLPSALRVHKIGEAHITEPVHSVEAIRLLRNGQPATVDRETLLVVAAAWQPKPTLWNRIKRWWRKVNPDSALP